MRRVSQQIHPLRSCTPFTFVSTRISEINCNALLAASEVFAVLAKISVAPFKVSAIVFSNIPSFITFDAHKTRRDASKTCLSVNQSTKGNVRTLDIWLIAISIAFRALVVILDGIVFKSEGSDAVSCVRTRCRKGRWRRKVKPSYPFCRSVLTRPDFNSFAGEFILVYLCKFNWKE